MYKCVKCDKEFQNSGALRMHKLWKHNEKSQALSQEKQLKENILEIVKVEPEKEAWKSEEYECPKCGVVFVKESKDEIITHCPKCGVEFEDAV